MVYEILRTFARDGRPMRAAWISILCRTTHVAPVVGPLDGFRHPLADESPTPLDLDALGGSRDLGGVRTGLPTRTPG
ncbi:hypothetical protein OG799_19415 [Micromonospora sp. NBC_00898]|uniref:hypothetical protein n=1 Tax=Micromonospora sp. NBC_00898 TaxID=2975981 RepID=UPI003870BFFA|nr:hypothetical protein OG799_19415 [Micromonospora sp. NBC_00898]